MDLPHYNALLQYTMPCKPRKSIISTHYTVEWGLAVQCLLAAVPRMAALASPAVRKFGSYVSESHGTGICKHSNGDGY